MEVFPEVSGLEVFCYAVTERRNEGSGRGPPYLPYATRLTKPIGMSNNSGIEPQGSGGVGKVCDIHPNKKEFRPETMARSEADGRGGEG